MAVAASCSLIIRPIERCRIDNSCEDALTVTGTGGSGGTTSSGGSAGSAGSTTSSSSGGGGTGGTILAGGGGAGGEVVTGGSGGTVSTGGSGGAVSTGGSGGSVSTGGSGGSPPTIVLEWTFVSHPPNVYLGIAGVVDFPAPTPDIDPVGRDVLLPSCLAPNAADTVVTCDVGVAQSGTVLHVDLDSYDSGGGFLYYHCDDPVAVGAPNAKCEGTLTVTIGSLFATCSGTDPLASPCTAEVNPETGRRRYVITIP